MSRTTAQEITQGYLTSVMSYSADSGDFLWLSGKRAGRVVGTTTKDGYRAAQILQRKRFLHRLAYLYVHGEWPDGPIDHINGDKTDNRIANLRATTLAVNTQNQRRAMSTSRTGVLGVSPLKCGRFQAQIKVGGRSKYLGLYPSKEEAYAAYVAAKRVLHEGCTL